MEERKSVQARIFFLMNASSQQSNRATSGTGRWRRGRIRWALGQSMNGAVESQNMHDAGIGRKDVFGVLRESVVQDFEAANGFGAVFEISFGGGGDELDGFGLGVGARHAGLRVTFGLQDFGLLLALGL